MNSNGAYHPQMPTGDVPTKAGISLSGKVVLDDGSALTDSAAIQTICKSHTSTETHTDLHGGFSFQFSGAPTASNDIGVDAESSSRDTSPTHAERRGLEDCQLQAALPGFKSDVVELARFKGTDFIDIGRVVLHRLKNVEGFTISATTAQAPGAARKALEKGQQQEQQSKWDDAQRNHSRRPWPFTRNSPQPGMSWAVCRCRRTIQPALATPSSNRWWLTRNTSTPISA